MKYIGQGSYGKVYKIDDNTVIKKTSMLDDDMELCRQNLQETICLKKIKHPNIINAKNISIKDNDYYIEMPMCDMTLSKFIRKNKYDEILTHLDFIIYQLVHGLYCIHQNGLIHGDLKPKNIMYNSSTKIIKIIDFGAINTFRFLEEHTTLCTLDFRPPEAFKKFKKDIYNGKFDVWSLGAIIYYYLTGNNLIDADYNDDKAFEQKFEDLMKYDKKILIDLEIKKPLKSLLRQMLYFDPKKRISTDELINHKYFKKFNNLGSQYLPLHLSFEPNTNFIYGLDQKYIKHRNDTIEFVYKFLSEKQKLNCFVLTIVLTDMFLYIKRSLDNSIEYKELAALMMLIVSNILSEDTLTFVDLEMIEASFRKIMIEKIKEVINVLDFELYYDTFDWILYKYIGSYFEIDYDKIKSIISDITNVGKNNEYLMNLYLDN